MSVLVDMSMIRIKGLISLLVAGALFVVVMMFAAGPVIKWTLESQLGAVNGAEVNIEEVSISYWPFALTINGLYATDKEQPDTNIIEFEKALLKIKSESLLKSKFIITDMQVDKIQFATARNDVGEVYKETEDELSEPVAENNKAGFAGGLELPDIDELMNNADLKTPAAFKAIEERADKTQASWKQIESHLQDKKKWDVFKNRYQQIKAEYKQGNSLKKLKALKKLKTLNEEIKIETKKINQQKNELNKDYKALKHAYKEAKAAPDYDLEKLKNTYSFKSENLENISSLIFDDKVAGYISLAKKYYKKLQPYLESEEENEAVASQERNKGQFVLFNDQDPEPDFLIQTAQFSAALPSGMFLGKATNIASDQRVQNRPSVIALSGEKLKHSQAENIQLVVDVRDKKNPTLKLSYDIVQRVISDYKVAGGDTLPLTIKLAHLDMKSNITLVKNRLNGKVDGDFTKVNFVSSRDTSGKSFSSMIAASFLNINDFSIKALANGKVLKPKIKIKSDIDNKINKQLKARFSQIRKDYEKNLKDRLNQRYAGQRKKIETKMAAIEQYKKKLDDKRAALESKLNKYKK